MSDWVDVKSNSRTKPKTKPKQKYSQVDLHMLQHYVPQLIEKYGTGPFAVFLYGSMARGQQHSQSDIDLMIIWRRQVPSNTVELKKLLSQFFQRKVDLVNMVYRGTVVTDVANQNFLDNVYQDAIPLYGETDVTNLRLSQLIGKTI
jgi:predicted nucleotidyltransferase